MKELNYFDFHGRTAIITGSGSRRGIGVATARMLANYGAQVVLADIDIEGAKSNAQQIKEECGADAFACYVDLSSIESIRSMVTSTIDTFGKVDILVNNAGISINHRYDEISLDEWNKVLSVNLTSMFLTTREVIPYMKKNGFGRIVNVSSVSGRDGGHYGGAHYVATKGAAVSLAKHFAKQVAEDGITVNCVSPGQCLTDGGGLKLEDRKPNPACPMKRRGTANEIAAAIVFLASNGASYITGVNLDVNGGLYMA